MRYVGPYFRKLGQAGGKCESASGRRLELYIRKQIGLLAQQMKVTGQTFGKRINTLSDGLTSIEVMVWREHKIERAIARVYTLKAPERNVIIDLTLLNGWWHYVGVFDGMFQRLFPRIDTTYGPWSQSTSMGMQVGEHPLNSVLTRRGSQFSGRMREVVQVLGGAKDQIKYDYHWSKTHGIFINQVTDQWWVIEISQANGVLAWPLPVSRVLTVEEKTTLGVTIPVIPAFDGLMELSAEVRVLLAPDELDNFYVEAWSYTAEMGWAFSYDGTEAANISILAPNSDRYANVWKIEITADSSGNPVSATLTGIEHSDLDMGLGYLPKYPHYIPSGCGWTLLSFTGIEIEQNYSPTNTSVAGSDIGNCPLDVFYLDGDTDPVIARHYVDNDGVGTTTVSADWAGGDCFGYIMLSQYAVDNPTSESSWSETVVAKPEMYFSVGRPASTVKPKSRSTSGPTHTQTVSETGARWAAESQKLYKKSYTINGTAYSGGSSVTEAYQEVFFKPLFDRELFGLHAHYQKIFTVDGGWQTYRRTNICGGDYLGSVPLYSGGGLKLEKFPNPTCSTNYGEWVTSDALVLESSVYSVADSEGYQFPIYQEGVCGPGNDYYYTKRWDITAGPLSVTCSGPVATGSSGTSSTTSNTKTYLYDTKEKEWFMVRSTPTYSAGDSLIVTKEDCTDGVLQFTSYLDAFTGQGATYKQVNDGTNLAYWGTAQTLYPIAEESQYETSGWVGIPIIPVIV